MSTWLQTAVSDSQSSLVLIFTYNFGKQLR